MREREYQVAMMGKIYSEAAQVIVWLSDGLQKEHYSFDRSVMFRWLVSVSRVMTRHPDEKSSNKLVQILQEANASRELPIHCHG